MELEEKVSYEIAQQQIYAVRISAATEFPGSGDLKVFDATKVSQTLLLEDRQYSWLIVFLRALNYQAM